jgi:hypothetical protein
MKHYLFVMLLIVCGIGIATGEPVEPSLTYQGMLTDPVGTPLDGTYPMIFSLYDEPSGGTPLAINTILVVVKNGLFSTNIPFENPGIIDGRALWLGIKVGNDAEMTPRQELHPVLYALGLRPGVIGASFTTHQAGAYGYVRPV